MMKSQKRRRTYIIDGKPTTFGGGELDDSIVQACLGWMSRYDTVAIYVLEGEFPEWELLSAFQVFWLTKGETPGARRVTCAASVAHQTSLLKRLAGVFDLPFDELSTQFYDVLPLAQAVLNSTGGSIVDSWRKAVLSTNHRTLVELVARSFYVCFVEADDQVWRTW